MKRRAAWKSYVLTMQASAGGADLRSSGFTNRSVAVDFARERCRTGAFVSAEIHDGDVLVWRGRWEPRRDGFSVEVCEPLVTESAA